jgi:hypothetical protein
MLIANQIGVFGGFLSSFGICEVFDFLITSDEAIIPIIIPMSRVIVINRTAGSLISHKYNLIIISFVFCRTNIVKSITITINTTNFARIGLFPL